METPIAEIRAFLDNESSEVQEAFPGLIIQEDESGWELHPCGDKRVICPPPGDKNSPFYQPWIGFRSKNGIKLHHYVKTGFKRIHPPEQPAEEDDPVFEPMEVEEELAGDEGLLGDMTNKFSGNY